MTKLQLFFGFMITVVSLNSRADICQINRDGQDVQNAIQTLQDNYGPNGPFKVYEASLSELLPSLKDGLAQTKGNFLNLTNLSLLSRSEFYYLIANGVSYPLDLGFTYYFDKKSQTWTNLGRAINCKGITDYNYIQDDIKAGDIPMSLPIK